MSSLRSRAEVLKLEHLLRTNDGELDYLEKADAGDLRTVRAAITNVLFEGDRRLLQRVAVAAGRLPPPLVATISQRVFGPVLAARVAALIDRRKALELALRVPVEHLAEIAVHIDPRRVADAIALLPIDRSAAVARELDRRAEYVPMGRLVAHLSDEGLLACLDVVSDASLLRIALLIEDDERIAHVIARVSDERIERVVVAARRNDLWPEALALLRHVGDERRPLIAGFTAAEDDSTLEHLVRVAHDHGLWDALLPVVAAMDDASRLRLTKLAAIQEPEVIAAIVETAAEGDEWPALVPLISELPKATQQLVADAVKRLDTEQRVRFAAHAKDLGVLDRLGPVRKALKK